MTWIVRFSLISICILLFVACGGKQQSHIAAGKDTDMVGISAGGFDYTDTLQLEVHFAEWLKGVLQLPEDARREAVHKLMSDGNEYPESQLRLMEIAEHYLADPNSPVRDEEMFISVLEAFLKSPGIDDDRKLRPAELLRVANMNCKGLSPTISGMSTATELPDVYILCPENISLSTSLIRNVPIVKE